MPELPEVESTRRGLLQRVCGSRVTGVVVREKRLRWPISPRLARELPGQTIERIDRRAKYLLLRADRGTLILHLGMSGSVSWVDRDAEPQAHDHVDLVFGAHVLRYRDPRRFGSMIWTTADPLKHKLLAPLGPEPLDAEFTADVLFVKSRGRKIALRDFLLDGRVVVGVGNIYASEAAHRAGIHPGRAAGAISRRRYEQLVIDVKDILVEAIDAGGTTLRDYRGSDGDPGEYSIALQVYGREGQPCPRCEERTVKRAVKGQRSYFYCPGCQR